MGKMLKIMEVKITNATNAARIAVSRWATARELIISADRVRLLYDIGQTVTGAELRGLLAQCYEWDRLKRIQMLR